jgi:hypothetical protein
VEPKEILAGHDVSREKSRLRQAQVPGKTDSVVDAFRFVRRPHSERCAPRWNFLAIVTPHSSGVAKYLKDNSKNGGCSRKRALDSARNFAGGKLFLSQGKDKLGRGREAATSQTIAPSGWRGRDAGSFRCPQTSRDATTAISILFLKSPVRTAARNCDLPE